MYLLAVDLLINHNGFLPLITFLQFLAFNSIHCLYLHQKLCVNFCIRHDTSSSLQNFSGKVGFAPPNDFGLLRPWISGFCIDDF